MLIGEYRHTIDSKKRLAIPAKFRSEMGTRAVLTRGLDSCLFLYPEDTWKQIAQKLGDLPTGQASTRSFVRLMLAGAVEVEIDKLGRILIPEYLKKAGGLEKKVVLAGVFNRIELWDEDAWGAYQERSAQSAQDIAEKLGEIGAY